MASPRADQPAKPTPAPRTYAPGIQVPGTVYQIVKILGAGGMGTVYEVEDTSVGKRYVLKTLHPELGDRQDLARRMQNEARTLARLQHPNIVEVVTAGVTNDEMKLPFYVMERLEGQNIRVVIEKMRRLSVPHAVRITIDLLDALDRAHESGVIHRDVKPDNIFSTARRAVPPSPSCSISASCDCSMAGAETPRAGFSGRSATRRRSSCGATRCRRRRTSMRPGWCCSR